MHIGVKDKAESAIDAAGSEPAVIKLCAETKTKFQAQRHAGFDVQWPSPSHWNLDRRSIRMLLTFHLTTIWLFTYSDLKTTIIPKSSFGILSALCASTFGLPSAPASLILWRAPIVVIWCWINLLPFAIENQRQPAAILEDSINKAWRPLPSGRLTPSHARTLMLVLYPLAMSFSMFVGGLRQCLVLVLLGYWYNHRGGADVSCVIRNLINGAGFICYTSRAMEVALGGGSVVWSSLLTRWFAVIAAVVASTVHMQDMYDQAGDAKRGRRTVPLVLGDVGTRWTIAMGVPMWSSACLALWRSGCGFVAPVGLASVISWRVLSKRSVEEDKVTFRFWNLWMVSLYLLPLLSSMT